MTNAQWVDQVHGTEEQQVARFQRDIAAAQEMLAVVEDMAANHSIEAIRKGCIQQAADIRRNIASLNAAIASTGKPVSLPYAVKASRKAGR